MRTIRKRFQTETENLLLLPRRYRRDRRYPLVVALHGMGMTAEEFSELFEPLRELPVILFFPEGVHPFEIRSGGNLRIGRAWYLYTGDEEAFVASMRRSGRHLLALLRRVEEECSVDPGRRILLGFSQGGYFAGYLGIREAARLRGLVVIGARIKEEVLGRELARARGLKVLLSHGERDGAVSFAAARRSREALEAAGLEVTLASYPSGHHVTAEQVRDVRDWIRGII